MATDTDESKLFDEALASHDLPRRLSEADMPLPPVGPMMASIEQTVHELFDGLREALPLIRPLPSILFHYLDSADINAVAFSYKGTAMIGFYAAVVNQLHGLFEGLLAHSEVLPHIGQDQADLAARQRIRQHVARCMPLLALQFLTLHEFRHIVAGHTDYLSQREHQHVIRELQASSVGSGFGMKSQALEMDADSYAVNTGLGAVLTMQGRLGHLGEEWQTTLRTPEKALCNYLFAVYALFRLLGDTVLPPSDWPDSTHPPPGVRQLLIIAAIVSHPLIKKSPNLGGVVRKFPDVIAAAERAFAAVEGNPLQAASLSVGASPEASQHISGILEAWASIRNDLASYSYVGLP